MMKRILALLLSVLLVISLFAGCSSSSTDSSDESEEESSEEEEEEEESEEDADAEESSEEEEEAEDDHLLGDDGVYITGTPIVDEEITIEVAMERNTLDLGTDINEDKWAIKTASAATNVTIEWYEMASGTADEKLSVMLAGGDLVDVFFQLLSTTDILQYEDSFYPIEDLFDTYAQNIYAAMSQIDNWESMAYTSSGHVYSGFGFYQSLKENSMNGIQVINTTWIENVGLEMPTDWESYYEVLEAFRDQDANGNGDADDEIPYGWCYNDWCSELFDNESGRFGIPTYNSSHGYGGYVYVDETGTVNASRTGDNYYTYLTVMHQMYADGLIDPEGFSDTTDNYGAKIQNGLTGTFPTWTALGWLGTEAAAEYETLERFGYTGYEDNFYANGVVDRTTATQLVWVVSVSCEYPNAAVRYWDYLQSDQELSQAMALGEKGILWDEYEDGSGYYFLVPDSEEGMTYENMKYTYGFVNGCPLILAEDTPVNDAEQSEASALRDEMVDTVVEYAIPESQRIMPSYVPSEEAEELALYSVDLTNAIETFHSDAIVNGLDEESYAEYEANVIALGYDDYVEYYQHVYDCDWDE